MGMGRAMISLASKEFIFVRRIDGWAVVGSMHSGFKKNSLLRG
jgi:hypothetical protein